VVSLLPLIYFLPATRGNLIISPDDGVIFNIPIRAVVSHLILAGYVPLWNPYMFSGMPLFGAAQAGVLFPLNWFYLIFSIPVATNLMMLSTYVLAALGAYLYARRSGSNIAGAALTSIVWQFSGFLIGQIGHTNILHTAALLPWLLWAVDGYGANGKRSRGVLLAVIVALQVFAGHQQTFVYTLLVVAAYALMMWRANAASRQSRAYLWSLALVVVGIALAAVQLLPTLELLRHSLRSDATYDFFTSFSLPPRFIWTFFAPYVVGGGDGQLFRAPYVGPAFYAEYVGYVGLGTLMLASLAFFLKPDARTKFWGVVTLAGVILALGRYAPFGFYKLIYTVPVLNLFRVPARHLMEVEFALVVLAGRGLTMITEHSDQARTLKRVLVSSAIIFVVTCLAVTLGRPANFQLGRMGPVSILRAPELFMPIVVAAITAWTLWSFARRGKRRTLLLLLVVIAVDLCLFGQFSGWRVGSPKSDFELWGRPATVEFLRQTNVPRLLVKDTQPYRILTDEKPFDPDKQDQPGTSTAAPHPDWVPSLQPDIYMMYGIENASGYDGFGLARYSRLAGDMKVWGELTDPERSLSGESREMDLLNVRYLLARSPTTEQTSGTTETAASKEFPPATQVYGDQHFVAEDLNLSPFVAGQQLSFNVPPIEADHIALLTNLAWSENVPDKMVVAHILLHDKDGNALAFELRAGEHTSEWAYDRPDIRSRIKHKRAPVATSYEVEDAEAKYEAHTYVANFAFPRKIVVTRGEITVERLSGAPDIALSVTRITLADGERSFPLRRDWVKKERVTGDEQSRRASSDSAMPSGQRWRRVADVEKVTVFENTRMLPRAWLATGQLVATEEEEISTIRTGTLPGGEAWRPLETALVETSTGIRFEKGDGPPGVAEVTRNEPNRVEVKTDSAAPAILILSANHYPGWRAYVDGKSVDVMRVDYNLRGAVVPAGNHLVEFVYRPKSVLFGLVISLLMLGLLMFWWSRDR